MLPASDQPPLYSKPKSPHVLDRKISYFTSLKPYLSLHHRRTWFFLAVLLLQLLLLLSAPSLPFSLSAATPRPSPAVENLTSIHLAADTIPDSTAAGDKIPDSTAVGDKIPDSPAAGDAIHDSTAAGDAIRDSTAAGDAIRDSTAASDKIPDSPATGDKVTDSPAAGDRIPDSPASCPHGKVYVYDLPPQFNSEIVKNCDSINPWSSRCDALSNLGFGKSAAAAISRIVPGNVSGAWFWTDQFSLELIYHHRMLNYRCRTAEPSSAAAFYIPFYVGLAIEHSLFTKNSTEAERDRHCKMMLDWVAGQPRFEKSGGWDHFITLGRISWDFRRSRSRGSDWGSSCIYMPQMRNITRLLIERNPWDYFDVAVPYPTGFHPGSAADVAAWQDLVRRRPRRTLFSFAGATRGFIKNDFRGILLNQCYAEAGSCRVVDCGGSKCANGSSAILEAFLDSDFCLQPRGDSFTRRSIFDCMLAGSVPVFFWYRTAYLQYEWFLPGEPESYSVFIHRNEVKNGTSIVEVLKKFSKEKVTKMREKVIEYIPKIVYANNNKGLEGMKDAFDVAVEGVLRRVKEQEEGYKWK